MLVEAVVRNDSICVKRCVLNRTALLDAGDVTMIYEAQEIEETHIRGNAFPRC